MQFDNFKRIVTCFADRVDDVDARGGELLVQIRDETITARLLQRPDGLLVEELDQRMPATRWIINRLARIPLLADRICSYVSPPTPFVPPSGRLLLDPNASPATEEDSCDDTEKTLTDVLSRQPAGTTSVLYLTSDAGEGKTSLINRVAVRQAEAYKAKQTDWLLVPVPLGGRTFLRFDDVVVSALVNRLRFQLLYYDAFLELVSLGVLVPAFDGFEEMIVESTSGEALSALGGLVGRLRSAGTVLVAARKAYFDYPNFGSHARLFDSIGAKNEVAFGRLSLNRWDRRTFTKYATERRITDPGRLYASVSDRLDEAHPILTRAVLVERLLDVATEEADLPALLARIGQDERDYFRDFVASIVERETLKWPDKSGDRSGTLLTTDEHHELLSMIAQEMWLSATDELGSDILTLVVDMFAEGKSPAVARQIQERIKQHALLSVTRMGRTTLVFDHEDFRVFYLGQALGRALVKRDTGTTRSLVDKATLPTSAVAEAASFVRHSGSTLASSITLLQALADEALPASFERQNCGALAMYLLDRERGPYEIRNMSFPAAVLRGRHLDGTTVIGSYFHATGLMETTLHGCSFRDCHFERFDLDGSESVSETKLDEACHVDSVVRIGGNNDDPVTWFDPANIQRCLRESGFQFKDRESPGTASGAEPEFDDDLVLVQRFLRTFLRATGLNEMTIRQRLGVKAGHFFKELLPALSQAGVIQEVPYQGRGNQRRFRLQVPMTRIEEAMSASEESSSAS